MAYVAHDRERETDRSIRELVKEFRGLTGTAKQRIVLEATGLTRTNLSTLANGHGLQHDVLAGLLESMQANSKPVKPAALGIIGEDHIRTRLEQFGCDLATCRYRRLAVVGSDGLPMVVETAFAMHGPREGLRQPCRRLAHSDNRSELVTGDREPIPRAWQRLRMAWRARRAAGKATRQT